MWSLALTAHHHDLSFCCTFCVSLVMDVVVVVATQVHFTRVRDLLLERFPDRSLRESWPAQGVLVFTGAPGPVVDLICGEELDLLFLGGKMGPNFGAEVGAVGHNRHRDRSVHTVHVHGWCACTRIIAAGVAAGVPLCAACSTAPWGAATLVAFVGGFDPQVWGL